MGSVVVNDGGLSVCSLVGLLGGLAEKSGSMAYGRGVNMIVSLNQYVVLFYGRLGVAAAFAGGSRCTLNASGFDRLAFVHTYLGRYLGWFELAN